METGRRRRRELGNRENRGSIAGCGKENERCWSREEEGGDERKTDVSEEE